MRWGLVPSWAKDSSAATRMINARSETAGTNPAFRDALYPNVLPKFLTVGRRVFPNHLSGSVSIAGRGLQPAS